MKFSDRIGATTPPQIAQINEIPNYLRNALWNELLKIIGDPTVFPYKRGELCVFIAETVTKHRIDRLPALAALSSDFLETQFFGGPWYMPYNIVEAVVVFSRAKSPREVANDVLNIDSPSPSRAERIIRRFNQVLESELSGYSFVGGSLIPITDAAEAEAVATAVDDSTNDNSSSRHHLRKALEQFAKKPEPDYANTIKEAISAVEGFCKSISGVSSGGLKKAVDKLSLDLDIPQGIKGALIKLYGYTSDSSGIRHAMLREREIPQSEARFVLITCAAFINYVNCLRNES